VCRSSSWVDAGRDDLIAVLIPWDCTNSGAEKPSKKTLVFAQNLENKGSEFFRPARSMLLKVVRGKILETLELAGSPTGCVPFWHCGHGCNDRIVKDLEYLADNVLGKRLSLVID